MKMLIKYSILLLILFLSQPSKAQDTMIIYLNDSVFVRTITMNGKLISEQKIRTGYNTDYTQWLFDRGLTDDIFLKSAREEIYENRKIFFYDEKNKLTKIEIRSKNSPTVYIHYIPDKMIGIRTINKESCYPSGRDAEIELEVLSYTDKEICLNFSKTDSIICVPPLSKNKTKVNYKIAEGEFTDSAFVKNDSIYKKEILSFFGYNFTTSDFDNPTKKEISKTIYYYRTGNEALLNIYTKKKKEPIKRITLGNFKNVIKLNELKKGEYVFEIVDYTDNTKKKLNVILK